MFRFKSKLLTDAFIVEHVKHNHADRNELIKWCDANFSRHDVFQLPAPEHSASCSNKSLWCFVATTEPCSQFTEFHLAKWRIR